MEKPKPKTRTALNLGEACAFIEEKYSLDLRDMAGRQTFMVEKLTAIYKALDHLSSSQPPIDIQQAGWLRYKQRWGQYEPPYENFWHWLHAHYEAPCGCMLDLRLEEPDAPKFVKRALSLLKQEFAPKHKVLKLWVAW